MISSWWDLHGAPIMPAQVFLPGQGLIAECDEALAVAWLFVCPNTQGGIGLIEFMTTNPKGSPKEILRAVKEVFKHLQLAAKRQGCGSVMSFVKQDGSEQHLLEKDAWIEVGGVPHLIYGKSLY